MNNIFFQFSKNLIKNNSITKQTRLVISGSIVVFAIAFFSSLLLVNSKDRKNHEIREAETVITAVSGSVESSISTYKDLSRLIMLNERVIAFLRAAEVEPGITNDAKYGVMDVLNVCNGVDSVFIFRNDKAYANTGRGIYILDNELMEREEWKDRFLKLRGGVLVTINGNEAIFRKNGEPIVSIGRAIYDINSQKQVGLLQFNVSVSTLSSIISDSKNTEVAILSDDGTYLAGSEELAELYTSEYNSLNIINRWSKLNNKKRMIAGKKLEDLPIVVMCSPVSRRIEIPVETVIVLLIILVAFAVSMGLLGGYLQSTVDELIKKEQTVQKAEMRVLQEQIKPHFLYNSLGCISYMALEKNATDVYEALETLGSFYRNFLNKGDREIPLEREIKIVKDYLALQKLRYGDILEDEYDIAENTLNVRIPKLILQPLVENSIYHGIRLKGEKGLIKITTKMEGHDLHIFVKDTGVGMSEEGIKDALRGENVEKNVSEEYKGSGFGLRGTIDRIRYYCDLDNPVTIRSEEGEYTEIEIIIPRDAGLKKEANLKEAGHV